MIQKLIHPFIAVLVQLAIGLATGDWWAGAALGSGFFLGREHAQAEYRWIEWYGNGRRANLPWTGAFQSRVWDLHSMLGWILPIIFTVAIALWVTNG